MPFQDIDEVSDQETPRTPSNLNRLLRRIFVEDWNLKLLSLAVTLVLWFVVTGQNTPVNVHATVQLKFIRPEALEISNDPPKSVDVLLTGSKYKLDELNKTSLIASVDISDQRAGERVLRLVERARLDLPQGVTVDTFQPSAISIRLEPVIDRQLEIEAKIDGIPAEGYEVYSVRLGKDSVNVHGPSSNVNAIAKAPTETISLAGRRESFTVANVAIDISDPKVDVLEPSVSVDVEIGERRVEKEFAEVPVTFESGEPGDPDRAAVVVYGPPSALATLKSSDLSLTLPSDGDVLKATIGAPASIQNKLTLRSVRPSKFKSNK
jgi:YbbR domain-containing protein